MVVLQLAGLLHIHILKLLMTVPTLALITEMISMHNAMLLMQVILLNDAMYHQVTLAELV